MAGLFPIIDRHISFSIKLSMTKEEQKKWLSKRVVWSDLKPNQKRRYRRRLINA